MLSIKRAAGLTLSTLGSSCSSAAHHEAMKLLVLLVCLAGLAPAGCNVAQFGTMIKEKTGKSALSYNGYGCHCGLGGSKRPVDATDWCCHAHDCCYKKLSSLTCVPHVVPYKFSIKGGQITCGSGNSCQRGACECDKAAAECFKRNLKTFNKSYQNYLNFKCKGSLPSC